MEDKEIKIINRGKIAYLSTHSIFEERIEKINRNGQDMWAFVFIATDKVKDLLQEYDRDLFLKKYNASFKNIAYTIAKIKKKENEERYIEVNNIKFYYNPKEIEITEEIMEILRNFNNKEDDGYYDCYSMYIDPSQGLIIM